MTVYAPDRGGRDTGVAIRDHKLGEYLYNRLPAIYRQKDAEAGQTVDEVLRQLPDLDISKLDESVRGEYQLQRFMRVLGGIWNCIRSSVDHSLFLLDPDKAEAKWLPEIAKLLGWELNLELPVNQQRKELKGVLDVYRRKGRIEVLEFLIEQLTDFSYEFRFGRDYLLVTHHENPDLRINPTSTHLDYDNVASIGEKDDANFYHWGTRPDTTFVYAVNYIFLFLTQNLLNPSVFLLTDKIGRVGQDLIQWGMELVIVTDSFYGEDDWRAETQLDDSVQEHQETWKTDRWFWLHHWTDPEVSGEGENGTHYLTGEDFSWRHWYRYVLEQNYSDPPLVESDGDTIPVPPS